MTKQSSKLSQCQYKLFWFLIFSFLPANFILSWSFVFSYYFLGSTQMGIIIHMHHDALFACLPLSCHLPDSLSFQGGLPFGIMSHICHCPLQSPSNLSPHMISSLSAWTLFRIHVTSVWKKQEKHVGATAEPAEDKQDCSLEESYLEWLMALKLHANPHV